MPSTVSLHRIQRDIEQQNDLRITGLGSQIRPTLWIYEIADQIPLYMTAVDIV